MLQTNLSRTDAKDREDLDKIETWQALLTVVIPAYNEQDAIAETLRNLRDRLPNAQVIAVDDCSSDATAARAREVPGVRVVSHSYNCGYGGALKTGMTLADRDYVAWFDADGEHRIEDLVAMVERLHRDRLVAVIGQRSSLGASPVRAIGKWLIRLTARSLEFRGGPDLNCGLRVFRRDVICRYLFVLPEGFSASLTSLMVMLERRYPVVFHPVSMKPRIGVSKVRLRDGFGTLALVVRTIMLFAPLRIFLRGGLAVTALGLIYSVLTALIHRSGIPVAGALVTMTGLLLIAVGLIADQISQLRLIQLSSASALPFRPIKDDWQG